MIIAIDGPAAAGKGTLARRLASHFDLAYLDTGALYRAVALKILLRREEITEGAAARAAETVTGEDLQEASLREENVTRVAALIAAMPDVRKALFDFQRNFARNPPAGKAGVVLDGRDIGTVICPEPDVIKLYVHAPVEIRAQRRVKELRERGENAIYSRVLQDMKERDARDANRGVAALKKAADAFDLDTSNLDADQAFAKALLFVESRNRAAGRS